MTFKDIRIWSRTMTYDQLASCNIRCLNNKNFKTAFAYNSMMWLSALRTAKPHDKIKDWKYAIRAYNFYKRHP